MRNANDANDGAGSSARARFTTLKELIAAVDASNNGASSDLVTDEVPWEPGHRVEVNARGGRQNLEDRRVSIATENYTRVVQKSLISEISDAMTIQADGTLNVSVSAGRTSSSRTDTAEGAPSGDDAGADLSRVSWGLDDLKVQGDANISLGERMRMVNGSISQRWSGGVTRVSGMEGTICGGVWMRIYAGLSMTLAGLVSGDVYGGTARTAAMRLHLSALGYRSAEVCTWNSGLYLRSATSLLIPLPGLSSGAESAMLQGKNMKQAAKLGKLSMALCPFINIGVGVGMILPMIAMAIAKKLGWSGPKMVPGPPRIYNLNAGVHQKMAATETVL